MLDSGSNGQSWKDRVVRQDEIDKYLVNGKDFIDDALIKAQLARNTEPEPARIREILAKAADIESLDPGDAAALLNVSDEGLWEEIFDAAAAVKTKVYDNRVVTFAPLYLGSKCVNDCIYCGFRASNRAIERRALGFEEIEEEARVLAGTLGHKRLVAVYGEHPETDADYIAESMRRIYGIKVQARVGRGEIRRVNINAAPMSIADLGKLQRAGIGTFQVFQETYDHAVYGSVHPAGSIKANYDWRLYALHRAMEAGIDDVAIGALFGLGDWRFEVMGMLYHAKDLERQFGLGPHTVSMPRIEPAADTDFSWLTNRVSDRDFKRIVASLKLAIPYAGLIVTCRESPEMMRDLSPMYTQRDASSRIGVGAYEDSAKHQKEERQQFMLGDTRSLDEVVRELASMGYITSFCTAGYRCGRTGKKIMGLLKSGREGCFCKLNAVLTFQEWLEDFASPETKAVGEKIIAKELAEIKARVPADYSPELYREFVNDRERIAHGERDLYF
ncbi:MAG: [FeFe] hydrogenase H-cluster radical SAM maturase HydG [Rectinemataceae bacterium]